MNDIQTALPDPVSGNASLKNESFHRKLLPDDWSGYDYYVGIGDPEIKIAIYVLDSAGAELGFFCILILGCIFILLNQVDGKIFRLKIFLMNRDFDLINNEGLIRFVNVMLGLLSWISIFMPFLALAVWSAGLIVRATDFGQVPTGGICVALAGFSFIMFSFGILKIKWNNYRFKVINGICLFLAFCCLTAYQFVLIFLDESSKSFFGYSTVFLSANGLMTVLIIFFNSAIKGGSIKDILMNQMQKGQMRDMNRDQDFLEEVGEERANQKYFPTYEDVIDLFTISQHDDENGEMGSSFGGGVQTAFKNMSITAQRLVTLFMWAASTAIMIIYAYVIYWKFEESSLGFITMISVLCTDVFVYLIQNSGVAKSQSVLAIAVILNRVMLYVFGGNYWIYGYMVLYMIYGVILSHQIGKKRFPFEEAFGKINLRSLNNKTTKEDLSKSPEFLILVLTIMYVIAIVALLIIEPTNIPLPHLEIDGWTYPFYTIALYCFLLIVNFFCLLGTYRLFFRKKRKIEPQIHFYIKNHTFDMYWIFISCSFLTLSSIGLISYYLTDLLIYFFMIIFISIFIIAYLNAYLHYVMNDYEMFQDVSKMNMTVEKHNKRLIELREKVNQIKKDLEEGKPTAIAAESVGLAKNIIQQNKLKKRMAMLNKKIEQENIKLKTMKTNSMTASMRGGPPRLTLGKVQSSKLQSALAGGSPERRAEVNVKVQVAPQTRVAPEMQTTSKDPVNNTMLTPHVNDDDRLIQEEMKNIQKDDIYEGGEEEGDLRQVKRGLEDFDKELEEEGKEDIESSDEEMDLDSKVENAQELRLKRRLKRVYDWRTEYGWFAAFFKGKLRYNDYQIMLSLFIAHIGIIALAVSVSLVTDSVLGITIAVPLVHYTLAAFSLSKALSTDAKPNCVEYFFFGLAYAIQYGWGIANLFISYTSEDIDPEGEGAADAGSYMVVYLMVIPFITSALSAIGKWIDDKGQITFFFSLQLLLTVLQGIGMLVLAYIYMTYEEGIIVSVIIGVLCYIVLQIWIYVKNDYEMPNLWAGINILIVVCIIVAATVVSLIVEGFEVFVGVSISTWVFAGLLLVYAASELLSDLKNMEKKPVFYSPWVFPVYIYNPKKNDVESKNGPAIALVCGFLVLITWSVIASVWIYPHNVGVSLSILFEHVLVICLFHLLQASSLQLQSVMEDVDKMLIRTAWLDAKLGYINSRQAFNRESLMTYEKIRLRRDYFRNYMRVKEGRTTLNLEEKSEKVNFIADDEIDIDWVDDNKVNLQSNVSCYSYLFELEQEQKKIYQEELELIIQFQLLIVLQAENLQQQKRKYLFTFLQEKRAALYALGIVIYVPDHGSMAIRYARVITQIQKLSPEKQTMFLHLRDQFINEERIKDEKVKEAARIEEEKERQRQELQEQLAKKKRKMKANFNYDMPIDEMPDCRPKYMKILEEADKGKLFEDSQFKPDDESLGANCLNRGVQKWVRARDKPNCKIFKDKIDHQDVVQGALGDCYFLSAISVLGEKFVKKIILTTEEEWRKSGAFHIQFYRDGEPEDIIIDDYFPAFANDEWVFVRGGELGDELWPMILEKAYAKMYGSFNYIEAGKVQYALSDMTDGFPEQIDLKVEGANVQALWEKIKVLDRHGSLMGAGSPEHAMGDRAINELGIVQGHAYAILDIQEVDGHKLIQLRNPHGSKGVEWTGDWSDTCEKWDQRMRNKVGYQDSSNDGVFWMEILDFVQQYSFLYVCRLLDEEDGWVERKIRGEWKGASAEGLPSRANPNARLDFNPQYQITVTKPCDGFISLTQFTNRINMFKGKNSIFFMVSKVGGKRITKVDKATLLCKSGNPINLNIITSECDFDKSVKYPYKFTVLVANTDRGQAGEGEFELAVYATDKNIKVEPLPPPADFPK